MKTRCAVIGVALAAFAAAQCESLPYFLSVHPDRIVAIDVALEPDATLAGHTAAGASHITLVRRFVRGNDLHLLAATVASVMSTTTLENMNLRASGYVAGNWNGTASTALALDLSPDLRRLEERILEATSPYAIDDPETAQEFIATPDGSRMTTQARHAVTRFVPESSGVNYRPHVSVGPAQADAAQRNASQPFEPFTFKPIGVAVYQLNAAGSAARILWVWNGEGGAHEP